MGKHKLTTNVFDESMKRLTYLNEQGHRIVYSLSGGKDSGVMIELGIMAACTIGRLPIDVVMRDEEIMYPGVYEYLERMAARPEISFNWIIANQPVPNIYNRALPYFWVFDPLLPPEKWMRQPPKIAYTIPTKDIRSMVVTARFPPPPGKKLLNAMGLRADESLGRKMGIHSQGSFLSGGAGKVYDAIHVWPIYDWTTGDIFKAIKDHGWDYASTYDIMARYGISKANCRIAPPTMNAAGLLSMQMASKIWPEWFDKLSERLEGVRQAAIFGKRAVSPYRHLGETWEQCFKRECIKTAPQWIADRSRLVMEYYLKRHRRHSQETTFPEINRCKLCPGPSSWQGLTQTMYSGEPFSTKMTFLPYVEPEFFREGAGTWGGKPTW